MTDHTCIISGCDRASVCRKMCNAHYQQWYQQNREVAKRKPGKNTTETCSAEGCSEPYSTKGLCKRHYNARYFAENRERLLALGRERNRRYYLDNREKVLKRTNEYREAHRSDYRRRAREAYRRDPAKGAAQKALRRARNVERYRALDRAYSKANPDKMRMKTRKRYARKMGNGAFRVTERDLRRLVQRYDGCCAYCGEALGETFDFDHVVAISRGGAHSIGNLVPACVWCNRSKWNLTIVEWRQRDRYRASVAV